MYFATGASLTAAIAALPSTTKGNYKAFDDFYYAQLYMGSYSGSLSPIEHFVQIGAARGNKPNADFDPAFYKAQYADLKNTNFDAADLLFHYVNSGLNEGRIGNATLASSSWSGYLTAYPDVATYVNANLASFGGSTTNGAVAHYAKFGQYEGRAVPGGPSSGQTFTLTTSVDTSGVLQADVTKSTDTTGNDTFNATLTTLNSFDNINAGAGTDTFNFADSGGTALFAIPAAVTFAGFENVVVSRTNTGTTTGAFAITNSTFGSGVKTLSYTEASAGTAMTGATASVTLASANAVTVAAVGAGTFTTVAVIDTDATSTTTQGSTLNTVTVTKANNAVSINGNGVTTVNLDTIGALTTITSAAGARALTVNAAGTGAITGLTDAQATTVTLNQAGDQAFGALTVAKATAINVNATAAATTNATTATIAGAIATALNVGGTHAQTLTVTNAANPLLAKITVTGSGGVALGDLSAVGALTSVDTSGATNVASAAGAANATVANSVQLGVNTAFTGGAGSDTVTVGATTKAINLGTGANNAIVSVTALGTGGSITGDGNDTLTLGDANAQTLSAAGAAQTAFKTAVTGFSTLALGTLAGNTTIDTSSTTGFGNFTTVTLTGAAQTVTLANLATGSTVKVTGANTGVTTSGSLGANATDSLTVELISTAAAQAANFGTLTTPNLTNLNLVSSGSAAANIGGVSTLAVADTSLKVLNVSGTNGFALGTLTGTTGLTTINAGGLTGAAGIAVVTAANQFATTITGSSGTAADTINAAAALNTVNITSTTTGLATYTGASGAFVNTITRTGTGASTIVTGSGNDVITLGSGTNSVTAAAGADQININHGTATNVTTLLYGINTSITSATGANMDTVNNFLSGTDKIQLLQGASGTGSLNGITLVAGNTAAAMLANVADTTSVGTVANVYTALSTTLNNVANAFAASTAGAGTIVARTVTFANGAAAGTYLVINDGVAGFQGANDVVIKLTGTTTIAAGDFTVV